ncbi:MAG TPA: helix-turn-helix transcriptional regulator [Thermoanaerobaculia bacterium]|nr:helix-turn-helix transcriptional regulator [Thermoanaerobaculia bacterium]
MRGRDLDPTDHLPLKPVVHLILLALARGERHGYLLRQEVEELSEGAVRLDPGTLYRWLGRLLDDGLLERGDSPADDEDPRRRNYALSEQGRAVLEAESARLARLVAAASREGLVRSES